ncbi:hypothetical protein SASPL_152791 [Salvia splendens]|uniref:Rhamnogalacturonan endolyase n=1 Tax=Salvia splendens TaxID=180675 RepID=A0A8X8Z196_SALSN|nr:hypothetical protein SASPL_152791 [Salvia splendens]
MKTRDRSLDGEVPLNIDKRYILLRGSSGFYSYSIFEHMEGWPDLNIGEARIAFKLHQDKFHYKVISDNKQRIMPSDNDRKVGDTLDYREAVLITHSSNPRLRGDVDDKYQYSCNNEDNHVHGWISSTGQRTFCSAHYAGVNYGVRLRNGEHWKKVFGHVFVYLNSDRNNNSTAIWEDAKRRTAKERKKWAYDFPQSPDFPGANQCGAIRGRLLVQDKETEIAKSAYVGLAPLGDVGSWQDDSKGYQFWTRTDDKGYFSIKGVRPDTYNLYIWVPSVIGDYKHHGEITIQPGEQVQIGDTVYASPRNGPMLWEIGIPDRTAAEFYVPDPNPLLVNKLFINHTEIYRQYGLWNRYTDLYPHHDLVYTVGASDYRKDWFFAHVNRVCPNNMENCVQLRKGGEERKLQLRVALASSSFAEIQVGINNNNQRPHLSTGRIGRDNAIARHGIHGLYKLYSVTISGC